ncbi:MAG: PilZ domain-containing protein [Myxococcales bacterium]|nr:PilZ domain-containing protein [Myxococcales bacterium]
MLIQTDTRPRRAVRRAIKTSCEVVGLTDLRPLAERVLDLSPRGMRVASDEGVALGDEVLVAFRAPGEDGLWLDAEAEVCRIEQGFRDGDAGYCVGLRFTHFGRAERAELLTRLSGIAPPIPRRRVKTAAQRESDAAATSNSVWVRPILQLWSRPPSGVFQAV